MRETRDNNLWLNNLWLLEGNEHWWVDYARPHATKCLPGGANADQCASAVASGGPPLCLGRWQTLGDQGMSLYWMCPACGGYGHLENGWTRSDSGGRNLCVRSLAFQCCYAGSYEWRVGHELVREGTYPACVACKGAGITLDVEGCWERYRVAMLADLAARELRSDPEGGAVYR